jgi:hypothetical protein
VSIIAFIVGLLLITIDVFTIGDFNFGYALIISGVTSIILDMISPHDVDSKIIEYNIIYKITILLIFIIILWVIWIL